MRIEPGATLGKRLEQNDFVRTRLTHPLEVALFARSIGQNIGNKIICEGLDPELTQQTKENIGSVLECVWVLHDIGNPPFGHFGESAIQDWFKVNLPKMDYNGTPLTKIAENAGLEGAVIINKVYESEVGIGFNALTEQYMDMVKDGILDPAKVTRSALQNANSVASTLLTTESCVATIKEDVPAMPAAGGMGGMY